MNFVINKLDLPDDIKYEINSYCYNKLGYTIEEERKIDKLRKTNIDNLRIKVELHLWKKMDLSIVWLKPTKNGKYGVYSNFDDECRAICTAYVDGIINYDDFTDLGGNSSDLYKFFY